MAETTDAPADCTVRRTKFGKTMFTQAVDPSNDVERMTPDPAAAVRLTEEKATAVCERAAAEGKAGKWCVLDKDGTALTQRGKDDADAEHKGGGAGPTGAPLVATHATPLGEECSIAQSSGGGPFEELHHTLGIATGPGETSLRDVAAAALQEIKDLRELAESATAPPADPMGDPTDEITIPPGLSLGEPKA